MKVLSHAEASAALQVFTVDWENLIRLFVMPEDCNRASIFITLDSRSPFTT